MKRILRKTSEESLKRVINRIARRIVFELHAEELRIKNRNCPTRTSKYLLYPCEVKVVLREFEGLGERQVASSLTYRLVALMH
jgi:hypothetical protein